MLHGQTRDTLLNQAPLVFGRQYGPAFFYKISEEKYGRSFYAFGKTWFMDKRLPLNNRRYMPVGLFYHRFEKYCKTNFIAYNKKELARYRRKAVWSGLLFGAACFGFMPVYFDALNHAQKTGNYNWPEALFNSPRAPLLWALPVAEGISAVKLRSGAERQLKERIFLPDTTLN
jgi:hypothetical protein